MARRVTTVATPVAHLVGPGKIKVVNGQLAFAAQGCQTLRLQLEELRTVLCYGLVGVSDAAVEALLGHEIEVAWLTPAGHRCRGRLTRSDAPRTALRVAQHRALGEEGFALEWARVVVRDKVRSQREAARHLQRHGQGEASATLEALSAAERALEQAGSLDEVRGLEGSASAAWFRLMGKALRQPWSFTQRVRRPPTDPVNALLSLGYTWLLTRTQARAEAAGLEIALGGLHALHPGRPSLACDLMEPLRVPVVDRWVLALCGSDRLSPDDFMSREGAAGGICLKPEVFGRTLQAWELHWSQKEVDSLLEETVAGFVRRVRAHDRSGSEPPEPVDL